MSFLPVSLQAGLTALRQLPADHPDFYAWYTLILRFLFPILAILMLVRIIRSLVKASPKPEVWAYLSLPNGATEPLTHWENILGRSPASDVVLNYPVVSRQHAALIRTGEDRWTVHDLGSKSGTLLNGRPVDPAGSSMTLGDILSLGGVDTVLLPVSDEETARRKKTSQRPVSPWGSLILLTVFQALTALQFLFSTDEEHVLLVPAAFWCLCLVMWLYCLTLRALGRTGFEMETIAFFLSTLSLAVTASSAPASVLDLAKVRSGYSSAKLEYAKAARNLEGTVLTAPFSGKIADIRLNVWEQSGSEPFCTLIDDSSFKVEFSVLESEYSFLEKGQEVKVLPFAGSGSPVRGRISSINPKVGDNGLVSVEAVIPGDGRLIDGMNVKVTVERVLSRQLTVPKSAVVVRDNLDVLFRYNDGKAEWVYVNILNANSESYVVEANSDRGATLSEGELVIVSGNLNLADGSDVALNE